MYASLSFILTSAKLDYKPRHLLNNVDSVIFPGTRGSGRSDRNTSFLLLLHPIHGSTTFMHFSNLVRFTRIEENTLCCRSFSGVDMGHDSYVPVQVKVNFALLGGRGRGLIDSLCDMKRLQSIQK
jgi:hypothetical protein